MFSPGLSTGGNSCSSRADPSLLLLDWCWQSAACQPVVVGCSIQDAEPDGLTAYPPELYSTSTKPTTTASSNVGSGGGRVGQEEGSGHKGARVRHPVGAGISSVTTVGGGPPGKGWELLQYANTLWEFNHH